MFSSFSVRLLPAPFRGLSPLQLFLFLVGGLGSVQLSLPIAVSELFVTHS